MGGCSSNLTEAQRREIERSALIDREQEVEQVRERKAIKILLLGTGESGKSTVFKQMQLLYTEGFNDKARINFRNVIRKNVFEAIQQIIKALEPLGIEIDDPMKESAQFILDLDSYKFDQDLESLYHHTYTLWSQSEAVKKAFDQRNKFYIGDSASYYLDRVEAICEENYLPDNDDILRARLRTTGIVESTFVIESTKFTFIDVGGQRNERRKWIHSFDGVTTILFIAAISEYDQFLYEDESSNRMKEAIDVFAQITNSDTFKNTPVILFLNKIDLFNQKFGNGITPKTCFPDFPDGLDKEEAAGFIQSKFMETIENKTKDVYCHMTTAIDTRNVERVWNSCRGIILSGVLKEAGLSF